MHCNQLRILGKMPNGTASLVDDVVVLDRGWVIYHGKLQEMRRDPGVISAYPDMTEDAHA